MSVLHVYIVSSIVLKEDYLGFLNTKMTESPRKNILLMNLSLFTGLEPLLPRPDLGCSVQNSLTFSNICNQGGVV